ncbi:GNAT family N-acetyltransferase [Frigidibacter sp. ROC022]|uniref:GNAT family N-acetyltransferase n=1 Tax=Frigidibacter sp. ROC022 TaxID=2971796 RepID=UPI00215B30EB|nr:GNAT family N-acetyltransferase [Frigidibacter sp. ROC022]MCR8724499.1 GNAT family N-acetyltransferase [Frigidibacter sp. ROC022]
MPTTRPATPADAAEMAELLNEIIELGGSTAYEEPFDISTMDHHYILAPGRIACTVAEDNGEIVGFQGLFWPGKGDDPLPEGWAYIATFTRIGRTGIGVGRALFAATRAAARAAGVKTIDATIRADNGSGLAYYGRMGFVDYDRIAAVPLQDGTPVDRVRKRLDL